MFCVDLPDTRGFFVHRKIDIVVLSRTIIYIDSIVGPIGTCLIATTELGLYPLKRSFSGELEAFMLAMIKRWAEIITDSQVAGGVFNSTLGFGNFQKSLVRVV
jgi:hypothetical protein